jgi:hypothetical protein
VKRHRVRVSLLALVAAGAIPAAAGAPVGRFAQGSTVVDEGTFMVSRDGAPVGRESFKIVRAPGLGGQAFRAVATSAIGDERISVILATDSAGVPVSYDFQLSRRGDLLQRVQGRGRLDRFSILVQTRSGEAAREYVVHDGTVLIDENVFHHVFFVALSATPSASTIIVPRTATQAAVRREALEPESLSIGGRRVPATHAALADSTGRIAEWWSDAGGRLLKVALPRQSLVALRDDPPRPVQPF